MDFVELIKEKALSLYNAFSESPEACILLSSIIGIASMLCLRFLAAALLEMHRSRSNIKKIRDSYNFWHKLIMKPAWQECLHAKKFCRAIIVCHHVRVSIFLVMLVVNIMPRLSLFSALLSCLVFIVIDVPILVMHLIMDRHPFQRLKNEYRFQKYHNTKDHNSLF